MNPQIRVIASSLNRTGVIVGFGPITATAAYFVSTIRLLLRSIHLPFCLPDFHVSALEKERLKARKEGFGRYHDPGPLTENTPGSLGYASRAERFQTDAAAELKKSRDAVVNAREELLSSKREKNLIREENRWRRVDEEFNVKLEKQANLANGAKVWERELLHDVTERRQGSQNHSSIAYDPITLEYHVTPAGQKQKYEDDLTRFRAGVRTEKLHRQNSGSGYNPITVSGSSGKGHV